MQRTIKSIIAKYITTADPSIIRMLKAENETDETKVAKTLEKTFGKGKYMILETLKEEILYYLSDYIFTLFKATTPEEAEVIANAVAKHSDEIMGWIDSALAEYRNSIEG